MRDGGEGTVAAVVPAFDEGGTSLERTLRGLLGQARRPDHVLVVDDGSPSPLALPAELRSEAEVVRLAKNSGLAAARNHGARLTTTEFLLFVNCDVVLGPDWLEHGVAFMESAAEVGAVSGAIVPVAGPKVLRDWRLQFIEPKPHRSSLAGPTAVTWLVGHALLVRRAAFDSAGGFDPRFRTAGEDWDFSQRVRARGYELVHHPGLVAESHESASIDSLARKSIRNAGWDLRSRPPELACAATRPVRLLPATASVLRISGGWIARDLVKVRPRFLAADLAVAARSVALLRKAARLRKGGRSQGSPRLRGDQARA
jgi:GT2 family glycosyltransferase